MFTAPATRAARRDGRVRADPCPKNLKSISFIITKRSPWSSPNSDGTRIQFLTTFPFAMQFNADGGGEQVCGDGDDDDDGPATVRVNEHRPQHKYDGESHTRGAQNLVNSRLR